MLRISRQNRSPLIIKAIRQEKRIWSLRIALKVTLGSHAAEIRIIYVYEYLVGSPAEVIIKLTLSSHHALKTSKSEKMSLADIGHQTEIRKSDIHKFLDVTRMTCSHLDHSDLSVRSHLEQGKRHTDAVVQITLGRRYLVFY